MAPARVRQLRGDRSRAAFARELGVTERTVRRDLARAREGGVVLDVRRGRGGGDPRRKAGDAGSGR